MNILYSDRIVIDNKPWKITRETDNGFYVKKDVTTKFVSFSDVEITVDYLNSKLNNINNRGVSVFVSEDPPIRPQLNDIWIQI
jgi:hypothetical protein